MYESHIWENTHHDAYLYQECLKRAKCIFTHALPFGPEPLICRKP